MTMNMKTRLILILFSLSLLQCEEVVDGLAGIEPPVEIDEDAPPLVNPVDPGNPARFVPQVSFAFTPDITANGGIITDNNLSVSATVTNASQNPDPNVYRVVYEYTLTNEFGEVGQRASSSAFTESQFDFARLDEGKYTLSIRYRLQQSSTSSTVEASFTVDRYPGSGVIFLQNPTFVSSSNQYIATIWMEEIQGLSTAKIVLNYPSTVFEFVSIENTRNLATQNALLPQEILFLAEETSPGTLTLNLGTLSSAGESISGTGSIARIALRARQSVDGSALNINQETLLRNARNSAISVNNLGELRLGN